MLRHARIPTALLLPFGPLVGLLRRASKTSLRAIATAMSAAILMTAGAGRTRFSAVCASAPRTSSPSLGDTLPSLCPKGTMPDGDACVSLPDEDEGASEARTETNEHLDRREHPTTYDAIPRRPDRPSEYDSYRFPVPCERPCVVTGGNLDRPAAMQGREQQLGAVANGAVDVPAKRGTPVAVVSLEHQKGDAEVVFVGRLFGTTVVTRHALREAGQLRDYLLLFGHLDAPAPGLRPGKRVKAGEVIGFVGDSGSSGHVHLRLEARRVRTGTEVNGLSGEALIASENSVVCDPRNVLPLRQSSP